MVAETLEHATAEIKPIQALASPPKLRWREEWIKPPAEPAFPSPAPRAWLCRAHTW